jgi:hypothetical protein
MDTWDTELTQCTICPQTNKCLEPRFIELINTPNYNDSCITYWSIKKNKDLVEHSVPLLAELREKKNVSATESKRKV